MEIEGLGPRIVDQLVDAGILRTTADLYQLHKDTLLKLERFASKKAKSITIHRNKQIDTTRPTNIWFRNPICWTNGRGLSDGLI